MGGLFGGGGSKPEFTGLQTQTSTSDIPIPLAWGKNRLAPNIIWQDDFKSHKHKAGKGGAGLKGGSTYTYSGSFILALCWGEIAGIGTVYKDQSTTTLSDLGMTLFTGATPQAPWGYLTSKHPSAALGYAGIAYAAVSNYDLGSSNTISQHSFEVMALRYNTASWTGGGDADAALVIQDFLSDPTFGVGFNMDFLDNDTLFSTPAATTTGDNAFQTYCRAMGWGFSPVLSSATAASETMNQWADMHNTAVVWTGYSLKFVPYGTETITANGVTYVPNFPSRYTITDADFMSDDNADPLTFDRADAMDCSNQVTLTVNNRANQYNPVPVPWNDQALIDEYGPKPAGSIDGSGVCIQQIGQQMIALYGQRLAYIRNTFKFKLAQNYVLLEPADIVTLVDPVFGTVIVMITEIEENEDDTFTCTAQEWIESVGHSATTTVQTVAGTIINTAAAPGLINDPLIFEPPSSLTNGIAEVWVAVSGGPGGVYDPLWGGCSVYISTDNTTYTEIGSIEQPAVMGVTTATLAAYAGTNPDTTNTLSVDISESNGDLQSASSGADAAAGATLCYLDGEFIGPQTATLVSGNAYNLTNLYRGLNGSSKGSHASGVKFARCDDSLFKYQLPAAYIGVPIYFKFPSLNIFGGGAQDLASCTAYTYTPAGSGFGTASGGLPATVTGITTSGAAGYNLVTWTANAANDNVASYDIYRATGSGQPFGSATKIATVNGNATSYSDTTATVGQAYTYFVIPVNKIGSGAAPAGNNATATDSLNPQPFGFAFQWPDPTASKAIAYFDTPVAWTMPSGLANSQGTIGDSTNNTATAPTAQTDFDIQSPVGSSIGTMRFAASSLTATFIMAANNSIPIGQPVAIIAPSNLNGIRGTVYGSLKGTR